MGIRIEKTLFLVCQNGCKPTTFYQDGTLEITRHFSEDGEKLESDDDYGFTPKTEIKCRNCDSVAIKRTKITSTTVVIK